MSDYQKFINALRKCANEHEKDRTFTGHIIVSDLCRDTANLLESLEQEPILDKIRAEIEQEYLAEGHSSDYWGGIDKCLQIIDKYKAEGSNKDTDKGNDCNSCKHQKEVDGSNCYECVKGIRNNYTAESDIEKRKECPHKPCINHEDGCEEWAGCPCVYYKAESEVEDYE